MPGEQFEETAQSEISGDRPLKDPADDILGYAPFARHLAKALSNASLSDGFVTAIYGAWGTGKSTVLNFVEHYINQSSEGERPQIVYFNPWWFSGQEDLTRRFFTQITQSLSKNPNVTSRVIERLTDFANVVSEMPASMHLIAEVVPWGKPAKAVLTALKPQQKDVVDLRERLEKELLSSGQRILVFIDDVDRLTTEEIRQVFRLVKAVGNLPNIAYVIALDPNVAAKALDQIQAVNGKGEEYLEKIIQFPFHLPRLDEIALRRLLFSKLSVIFSATPDLLFEDRYWTNVYFDGIDGFIRTPRDVVRLCNTLSVTYPAVIGEVNAVDFIAIETLRVFVPNAYDTISVHKDKFVGSFSPGSSRSREEADELRQFQDGWLSTLTEGERERVKSLLLHLFPKLQYIWRNTIISREDEWRLKLRVCCGELFSIYFRLSLPPGAISSVELTAYLAQVRDATQVATSFRTYAGELRPDGTSRLRGILSRLEDHAVQGFPEPAVEPFLNAVFIVADELILLEPERRGILDFGLDLGFGRVILRILRHFDEARRFELLRTAIEKGNSIYQAVWEITTYSQEQGRYSDAAPDPTSEWTFNPEHLAELEKLVVRKINDAAVNGWLANVPHLPAVLSSWSSLSDPEQVQNWVRQYAQDDEGFVRFLVKFLGKTYTQAFGDRISSMHYRLDPKWLEPYLDVDQAELRAIEILRSGDWDFDEIEELALKQFLQEITLRRSGIDPDHPTVRDD